MAASTQPREASRKDGRLVAYPVLAGVTVNKGTLVSIDATGYLRPARSGTTTDIFAGVAFETANNATGTSGAVTCRVEKFGVYSFPKNAATAQTDLGQAFYAADDQDVTLTLTSNQLVGYCVGVIDANNLEIRINSATH